jgi:HK97 gp10 family phage protein
MSVYGDKGMSGIQFRLEIVGLKQLEQKLNRLGKSITKSMLNKASTAGAKIIKEEAKSKAQPIRDTGVLRRSIAVKRLKGTRTRSTVIVGCRNKVYIVKKKPKTRTIRDATSGKFRSEKIRLKDRQVREVKRNPARYAHVVELGTKYTRPQPFLRPAIKAKKRYAEREMLRVLKVEVKKKIAKIAAGGK